MIRIDFCVRAPVEHLAIGEFSLLLVSCALGQFVVELLVAVVSLFGRRGLGLPPRACLQTHHSTSCHSPLGVALLVVLLIASKP